MRLDEIPQIDCEEEIFRLANPRRDRDAVNELIADPRQFEEAFRFISERALEEGELTELLTDPFQRKACFGGNYCEKGRYSDGTWPVLYSGLEQETALQERAFHYRRGISQGDQPTKRYWRLFSATFRGLAKDLRPKADEWPQLTADDYSFCQEIGREVHDVLHGLIVPSARRPAGSNVPVFAQQAVSAAIDRGFAVFELDRGEVRVTLNAAIAA